MDVHYDCCSMVVVKDFLLGVHLIGFYLGGVCIEMYTNTWAPFREEIYDLSDATVRLYSRVTLGGKNFGDVIVGRISKQGRSSLFI